jgi:transposase
MVARAKELLAVAEGRSFTAAAAQAARRSSYAVCHLVRRFNREGFAAVLGRHGGGAQPQYTAADREKILKEALRPPDRQTDGTGTWSLTTLQKSLRRQGLTRISTYTIWTVLHEAGVSWQQNRKWCHTGTALRKRKEGVVTVSDPDSEAKKS